MTEKDTTIPMTTIRTSFSLNPKTSDLGIIRKLYVG
jgi:hypothetical protein